jgi:hypothetical protein
VAKYIQIGKTVHFYLSILLGASSSVGANFTDFSLPVTAESNYVTPEGAPVGTALYRDSSAGTTNIGAVRLESTTTARFVVGNAAGTYLALGGVQTGAPFTWANGDRISCSGTYQAA